jgi:SulP family sulfate permease
VLSEQRKSLGGLHRLPFLDLAGYSRQWLLADLSAALALTFLVIPQGIAYALIAGLPPAMGLYAAGLPVVIGSLMRSSRHAITGPTNAVSLLVSSMFLGMVDADPLVKATTLAFLVGLIQLSAGVLRLGALIDYLSRPVLLGFVTGAGILIGAGQLHNATRTPRPHGHNLFARLADWASALPDAHLASVGIALGCVLIVVVLRRIDRRIPSATVVMIGATALSMIFDWRAAGVRTVADISPVTAGLPPLSIPSLGAAAELLPLAAATAMLSLVETSAVARSIASRTGHRVDITFEFIGEGLANLTAAFCSGYPTAGSLSRSSLNEAAGAKSRLAGISHGVMVLIVLASLGSLVNHTPIACLAGILFVVAWRLVELHDIRRTLGSHWGDRLTFLSTLAATWFLHLDQAIYLGVALSLVMFLRQERMLSVRDLVFDTDGRLRDVAFEPRHDPRLSMCQSIHMVNLEGPMFFGAASELSSVLSEIILHRQTQVLVLRLKRTDDIDVTTALMLEEVALRLREQGRQLVLVGMRDGAMKLLRGTGVARELGPENLFPSEPRWYAAMEGALRHSLHIVSPHACGDDCAIEAWLAQRGADA